MKLRSALYKTARIMGHAQAIRKGPKAVAKRVGRVGLGRVFARILGSLFR